MLVSKYDSVRSFEESDRGGRSSLPVEPPEADPHGVLGGRGWRERGEREQRVRERRREGGRERESQTTQISKKKS